MKTLRFFWWLARLAPLVLTACAGSSSDSGGVSHVDGGVGAAADRDQGVADGAVEIDEAAEAGNDPCAPGSDPQHREQTGAWLGVDIPGTVCANGSPYRLFVKYAAHSHDLAVTFEGGGACWDYATCSGAAGQRGASNLDGIATDYMTALPPPFGTQEGARPWSLLLPHLGASDPLAPTASYHQVFFPYCTGDVFAANTEIIYHDPAEGTALTVQHRGRENVRLATDWLAREFPVVGRLLVTGFSAGGIGSLVNYPLLRDRLTPRCGYLLDDSGPLLSQKGYAGPMLRTVRSSWQLDSLLAELNAKLGADNAVAPPSLVPSADPDADAGPDGSVDVSADMGGLLTALARHYPSDRFLLTLFGRDLNFSLFAYQRFYQDPSDDQVYAMWDQDIAAARAGLEALPNAGYFMPAFRPDNCSHCLSVVPVNRLADSNYVLGLFAGTADPYVGTEISPPGMNFRDALANLLGSEPLLEMVQVPKETDRLNAQASQACR